MAFGSAPLHRTPTHQRLPLEVVQSMGAGQEKDPTEAGYLNVMLKELTRMAYMSVLLNPDVSGIKQTLLDTHYLRKH